MCASPEHVLQAVHALLMAGRNETVTAKPEQVVVLDEPHQPSLTERAPCRERTDHHQICADFTAANHLKKKSGVGHQDGFAGGRDNRTQPYKNWYSPRGLHLRSFCGNRRS